MNFGFLKHVDKSDYLIFSGLLVLGAGLYLWFGPGIALSVVGGIVTVSGFIGSR